MFNTNLDHILDNLDIKILSAILNNCRESYRQIGKELGISGGAVGARIRKMEEAGIIEEFTLKIEPPILGYGILYLVVKGQDIREILEQAVLIGQPFFVVPCVGGITVCSIVVKDGLAQKIELAKQLMKDVKVLSIFEAESPGFDMNLTRTDLEVIESLMADPRKSIETISSDTGLSTKTVARCIEKMHWNEGVQFTLVYDPIKFDKFIPHVILACVDGDLKGTLELLEERFSESFLQVPVVAKNQIVLFMYSRDIFEMDDLTQRVKSIDSVSSVDLFIPKKISFWDGWLKHAVKDAKRSPRLHLGYRTELNNDAGNVVQ